MIKRTTYSLVVALLAFAVLTDASPASALPCGVVTAAGSCDSKATLLYCGDGQLVRVECPAGELCVTDDDRFDGAAGCVAASLAGCDAVDEAGACDTKDTLVFCEAREVKRRSCPDGTSCGWVEEEGWFDCISNHLSREEGFANGAGNNQPPTPVPDSSETVDNQEPELPGVSEGPVEDPTVATGGAPAAGDFEAAGTGCGLGRGAEGSALFLALAGLWLLAMRGRQRDES